MQERNELEQRLAKQRQKKVYPNQNPLMDAARDELEEKLAKQRQKHSDASGEMSTCDGSNLFVDSLKEVTSLDTPKSPDEPSAISPSADSGISVRSPPPVARKPFVVSIY
ncbi:unnamed protein product [Enterobius vermicularis]|uniref:SUZ domain-containing protein n=1 Tax=Enterobius vermicularis TaxID=51028 RepID=A0A0N4VQ68_ENTVE|nr:unnamed protein product [Enterobius vermicularis]